MGLAEICAGFAARFATIDGLRVYADPADSIALPAMVLGEAEGDYDLAMNNGGVTHRLTGLLLVSRTGGGARAVAVLHDYIAKTGTKSIRAAVQGDVRLSVDGKPTASTSRVVSYGPVGIIEYGGVQYVGCPFRLEAWEA
jgi:hypothetical protein